MMSKNQTGCLPCGDCEYYDPKEYFLLSIFILISEPRALIWVKKEYTSFTIIVVMCSNFKYSKSSFFLRYAET